MRSRVFAALAVAAAAGGWLAAADRPASLARPSVRLLAAYPMVSDAGGTPLFPSTTLAPGAPVANCVVLSVPAGLTGTVAFGVEDLTGPLAPYLTATVAVGRGGRFGDCGGFAGRTFYSGGFSALAAPDGLGADGVASPWTVSGAGARTYRVTVGVAQDPRALGVSASATFVWTLVSAPRRVGPATTTTVPSRPAPGTPGGHSGEHASTPPGQGTGGHRSGPVPLDRQAIATRLVAAFGVLVRHGYPVLWLVAVVLAFLSVQDRLDRNDPKLALAPLRPDPDLVFLADVDPGPFPSPPQEGTP